jgi:hypothetical protein
MIPRNDKELGRTLPRIPPITIPLGHACARACIFLAIELLTDDSDNGSKVRVVSSLDVQFARLLVPSSTVCRAASRFRRRGVDADRDAEKAKLPPPELVSLTFLSNSSIAWPSNVTSKPSLDTMTN